MEFTGERFLPGLNGLIELEHLHRYFFSLPFVQNLEVLDIACGEGYGSAILATKASFVKGVDIDQSSIQHAKKSYEAVKNLEFSFGSLTKIPLRNNSVDVVTCFESIEHVTEHDRAIGEIKRVLKPDGLLLLSTPNKYIYSDLTSYRNPFHPKELYRAELDQLLSDNFNNHRTIGQRVALASLMLGDEANQDSVNWIRAAKFQKQKFTETATYFFSFASDSKIPDIGSSVYEGETSLDELLFERGGLNTNGEALKFLIRNNFILSRLATPIYQLVRKFKH